MRASVQAVARTKLTSWSCVCSSSRLRVLYATAAVGVILFFLLFILLFIRLSIFKSPKHLQSAHKLTTSTTTILELHLQYLWQMNKCT